MAGVFIEWPLLALVPAGILLILGRMLRRTMVLAAGAGWLFYAAYELGMRARILCSGECNIRIDLFVVYPVLGLLTLLGVVNAVLGALETHTRG